MSYFHRLHGTFKLALVILGTVLLTQICAAEESVPSAEQNTDLLELAALRASKEVCSGIFVSQRPYAEVLLDLQSESLNGPLFQAQWPVIQIQIERDEQRVIASTSGGILAVSSYFESRGCVISHRLPDDQLSALSSPVSRARVAPSQSAWPAGHGSFVSPSPLQYDSSKLDAAVSYAFEAFTDRGIDLQTRGFLVVHDGKIIVERYADGFTSDTKLYGASMSKSVAALLIGARLHDGILTLDQTRLISGEDETDNLKSQISLEHLLRMSSGLQFEESYSSASNFLDMFYLRDDMASFAASLSMAHAPNRVFNYSSGTSNLLMLVLRESFSSDEEYWSYPYDNLFAPLGMNNTLFETDGSGTFVGSSYLYSTPRDFARLGQLLIQDGVWEGRRILAEGFVAAATTPSDTLIDPSGTRYAPQSHGMQIWLDPPHREGVPASSYLMHGYGGQFVQVYPDEELIIVRMGWNPVEYAGHQAEYRATLNRLVLDAIGKR